MLDSDSAKNYRALWSYMLPAIVLSLGLCLTLFAYGYIKQQQATDQLASFDHMAEDLTARFDAVLRQHEDLLVSIRGFFVASRQVTRKEFNQFIASVDLRGRFPAVHGIGWHPKVTNDQVDSFEQWVRTDTSVHAGGYPEFRIRPVSNNPVRFPLTFVAPEQRLQLVQGLDLGAIATRRVAITVATDTGQIAASPPIELLNLPDGPDDPAGMVIALPVYETVDPPDIDSRRDQLVGVISGAFRIQQLLDTAGADRFDAIQVFDVTDQLGQTDLQPSYTMGQIDKSFHFLLRRLNVAGRQWHIYLYQSPATMMEWAKLSTAPVVVILGVLVSLISATLLYVLITSRNRALSLARTLNQDLQRANVDLSRSNRDLAQFAQVASHDLQTPVRNVQSTIMLLEAALEQIDDPSIKRYLEYLQQSALRMQNLLSDLLFYARTERSEPDLVETDLGQVFDQTVARLEHTISDSGAKIDVQALPVIMGDADRLERVFSNLIVNAIKYRAAERSPIIQVYAEALGSEWAIHISDNGRGIEHRHLQRIFEPFKRLHRHDEIEGTGLGLSICKEIISSHGGRVHVKSTVGEGSVFTLFFSPILSACKAA